MMNGEDSRPNGQGQRMQGAWISEQLHGKRFLKVDLTRNTAMFRMLPHLGCLCHQKCGIGDSTPKMIVEKVIYLQELAGLLLCSS
ncbi:hypothetical protein P7K49_009935 [Saguinus oedipus]|uniref:Uncharacterized protein n=1 Tax=Saguinus oedipus TaxID=9490 RepID=A0ABQ9VLC9_SAGOE|nr:hypothetical protein P7K49_009935 [Saguinus oedipus]